MDCGPSAIDPAIRAMIERLFVGPARSPRAQVWPCQLFARNGAGGYALQVVA